MFYLYCEISSCKETPEVPIAPALQWIPICWNVAGIKYCSSQGFLACCAAQEPLRTWLSLLTGSFLSYISEF